MLIAVSVLAFATALAVGTAGAVQTHAFKGFLGSAEEPTFFEPYDVAVDPDSGDVLVLDVGADKLLRFNPDGTPSNFAALGSNAIDGAETPEGNLAIAANRQREQVAIDDSGTATDGNIYITQSTRDVVDVFAASGAYLGRLSESTESGAFGEPCGVAVDENGTVYVGDRGDDRIHVYEPAANPPVNGDNTANFNSLTDTCTMAAGAGPTAGFLFVNRSTGAQLNKLDATTGEVEYQIATGANTVEVDPGSGNVYAALGTGDGSEVAEYDASGALEATQVSSTNPDQGTTINGIGASGDLYLTYSGTLKVGVFDAPVVTAPEAATQAVSNNTGARATLNGTVNPDGVELDECFFEWGSGSGSAAYTDIAPCAETPAEIGAGTSPVAVHADISGLLPNDNNYHYRLATANADATARGANVNFSTSDTVFTEAASGITPTEATLNGSVNPDTEAISECVFEWGPEKGPFDEVQAFPETAPCVPGPGGIGTGTSPVAVQAELSGLHPGTTYLYRLKAGYPAGAVADNSLSVQTLGPAISDTWAEDVIVTEATLKAKVNPELEATSFRFEYGPTPAYGSQSKETEIGSGGSPVEVTAFLDDLQPGTTYHYRAVATNGAAVNEGPDREIRTFRRQAVETDCPNQANRYGAGATLPDCRAYEMVSPLDKNNGDIKSLFSISFVWPARNQQSTPSGEKITYSSYRAFADARSAPWASQYIAERGDGGWDTHSINAPREEPLFGVAFVDTEFVAFTDDLCQAWMHGTADPPLAEGAVAGQSNLYRRDDRLCAAEDFKTVAGGSGTVGFQGISSDGSHAIFRTGKKLTAEGIEGANQLYESTNGSLRFVCILPSGEPLTGDCMAGSPGQNNGTSWRDQRVRGAISADGERIYWQDSVQNHTGRLFVRVGGSETAHVSRAAEESTGVTGGAEFWGAAKDGSRAIFTQGPGNLGLSGNAKPLFSFELEGEETELIANGVNGVMGMSEDARRVYFVSGGALAPGAIVGKPNLYFYDADAGGGSYEFIATLAPEDIASGHSPIARSARYRSSYVTFDGLHATFTSHARLTGYDNIGPQAYVYDATTKELVCASCNPSGARVTMSASAGSEEFYGSYVIRAPENSLHELRALSEDGSRLYIESRSPLTPRDTNNRIDVYQWEAEGKGGCDAGDSSYAPSANGCIDLLSDGVGAGHSQFVDASVSGDDVFILTSSSLVAQDYGLQDLYDVREGGGFPPPSEPPECVGDACQGVPPAPNDRTPASAGFRGAGDPAPRANCGARARRAAKLSRRAKRLRRAAKRSAKPRRSKALRRRSTRFAKQAKRFSKSATRCRRANRRVNR